ncbi:leucine rich repeat domain containing protein [Musa troglodytarum]|uniref:Leucine rich repeat domain containing protein n=1 Tax=Musa troglodytarum TaxID=320322 RepID=A0A9E7HL69_9LILI|nr:leucine rich repeat domain containing protein [Musa troglodytarum]
MTSCSADKVTLKTRSSSQVLPSGSRKLFPGLGSQNQRRESPPLMHPSRKVDIARMREPRRNIDRKNKKPMEEPEIRTDLWPQNQWVAFYAESSSLDRVDAWVHSLDDSPFYPIDDGEVATGVYANMDSTEVGEPSGKNQAGMSRRTVEEIV